MVSKCFFVTRKVSTSDLDTICKLEERIFRSSDQFSRQRIRYLLSSKNTCFRFCYASKCCIGYGISLLSRLRNGVMKGRIYSIGILQTYQRQGAGSILLKAMEQDLARSSVSFITLETKKGDIGATTFFKQHGYRVVKELPKYYHSGAGLRMRKDFVGQR